MEVQYENPYEVGSTTCTVLPVKPVQGQAQHTFFRAKVIIPRHFLKFGVSCCKSGVVQRRKKSDANASGFFV